MVYIKSEPLLRAVLVDAITVGRTTFPHINKGQRISRRQGKQAHKSRRKRKLIRRKADLICMYFPVATMAGEANLAGAHVIDGRCMATRESQSIENIITGEKNTST